jgi:D-alanine transaminase
MALLPVCHLNGRFLPLADARISPLDRGFLFADAVYEVLAVYGGRPFRFEQHCDRLGRSLAAIGIDPPHDHAGWLEILMQLVGDNGGGDMYVYLQVSRGAEQGRNHLFPSGVDPTVFAMAATLPLQPQRLEDYGTAVITTEDQRWARCDIKSTGLLANVLAKQQAAADGAGEALLVRDGEVMEGASMSVFVVIEGRLATPPNGPRILPGCTRDVVLELAEGLLPIDIRPIRTAELRDAEEVWLASTVREVIPVTRIDGQPVGDGRPGRYWRGMHERFQALKRRLARTPTL